MPHKIKLELKKKKKSREKRTDTKPENNIHGIATYLHFAIDGRKLDVYKERVLVKTVTKNNHKIEIFIRIRPNGRRNVDGVSPMGARDGEFRKYLRKERKI